MFYKLNSKCLFSKFFINRNIVQKSVRNICLTKGQRQSTDTKGSLWSIMTTRVSIDGKNLSEHDPFHMTTDSALVLPDVPCREIITHISLYSGTLTIGVLLDLGSRLARRLTYGAQVSQAEHDRICQELKEGIRKSEDAIALLNNHHKERVEEIFENLRKLKNNYEYEMRELKFSSKREIQVMMVSSIAEKQTNLKKLEDLKESYNNHFLEWNDDLVKVRKSSEEEICNLKHSHNTQMKEAQDEISELKVRLEEQMQGAQSKIQSLEELHHLQLRIKDMEIQKLQQGAQSKIQSLEELHHLQLRFKDMEIQKLQQKGTRHRQGKRKRN